MSNGLAKPGETNYNAVDRFTIAHAGAGYLTGYFGCSETVSLFLALGWELIENPLKDQFPGMFPHASHDTAPNAIMDVVGWMIGWHIQNSQRKKK